MNTEIFYKLNGNIDLLLKTLSYSPSRVEEIVKEVEEHGRYVLVRYYADGTGAQYETSLFYADENGECRKYHATGFGRYVGDSIDNLFVKISTEAMRIGRLKLHLLESQGLKEYHVTNMINNEQQNEQNN